MKPHTARYVCQDQDMSRVGSIEWVVGSRVMISPSVQRGVEWTWSGDKCLSILGSPKVIKVKM